MSLVEGEDSQKREPGLWKADSTALGGQPDVVANRAAGFGKTKTEAPGCSVRWI